VHELAVKASVSPDTVFRLEKGETLHQRTASRSAKRWRLPAHAWRRRTSQGEVGRRGRGESYSDVILRLAASGEAS
jgi:hypothetical protein